MLLAIYFLSALFFILGYLYYSSPQKAQRINSFFNEKVFNDRYIILKRKKISVCFLLLGFLCSVIAFTDASLKERRAARNEAVTHAIYCDALYIYGKLLKENPDNADLLVKYGYVLESLGSSKKARAVWEKLLSLDPQNKEAQERLNVFQR
ncbi:MAG: hypothetical protein LBQ47_01860 [Endomicrobium sp.]|jgi:tetratricopeptide (TPR) repeat protein|nr:hypothetical protein [Endomicrobium sp.]